MIKREALKFYSQEEFNDYLSQLNDDTNILHYNVLEDAHYIITETEVIEPRKPYVNEQLVERVSEWCRKHNVIYDPKEKSFITVEDLLHDFNMWNHSNMSSQTFVPVFEAVGARVGNYPEKITAEILGTVYLGFKGITVNGKSSITDN